MISRAQHTFFRLVRRDDRGSIAPIFAVCILVLFGVIGLAVDFSMASYDYKRLSAAADSAALAAVSTAKKLYAERSGKDALSSSSAWSPPSREPVILQDAEGRPIGDPIKTSKDAPGPRARSLDGGAALDDRATTGETMNLPPLEPIRFNDAQYRYDDFGLPIIDRRWVDLLKVSDGPDPMDEAKFVAKKYMEQAIKESLPNSDVQTTVEIVQEGLSVRARVSFSAQVPTAFSRVIGRDSIAISGTASAAVDLAPFIDIHLLVDVSGSMGIGATVEDLAIMQTSIGCSFGCHVSGTYQMARDAGAKMRIDVVREAITRVIAASTDVANVRFAIHLFSSRLETLVPPSDRDTAALASTFIELDTTNGLGTNFHSAMDSMEMLVPAAGDGSTDSQRRQVIIIVTDGVEDSANLQAAGFAEDPDFVEYAPTFRDHYRLQGFNPELCTGFKERGVQVMAMYMPYITSAGEDRYDFIRTVLTKDGIQTSLEKCASAADSAFAASSPDEIDTSMHKLLDRALKSVRLTQ
jgi:Putative Flp pilus-assembly TadE/G-like/von Willebrand factor type A domain